MLERVVQTEDENEGGSSVSLLQYQHKNRKNSQDFKK